MIETKEISGRRHVIKLGDETYLAYVAEVDGNPDYGILGVLRKDGSYPLSRVFHNEIDGKRELIRVINPYWEIIEGAYPPGEAEIIRTKEEAILQIPKPDLEFLLGEEIVKSIKNNKKQ